MVHAKHWNVDIFIDELDERTRAMAILHTDERTHLRGRGTAHLNPEDKDVPKIGDELAAARALFHLAEKLHHAAARDIEAVNDEPPNAPADRAW